MKEELHIKDAILTGGVGGFDIYRDRVTKTWFGVNGGLHVMGYETQKELFEAIARRKK